MTGSRETKKVNEDLTLVYTIGSGKGDTIELWGYERGRYNMVQHPERPQMPYTGFAQME